MIIQAADFNLIKYLLEGSIVLLAFWVSYRFLLRESRFFRLNRVFLLFGLLLALVLPAINIQLNSTAEILPGLNTTVLDPINFNAYENTSSSGIQPLAIVALIYLLGALVFAAKLIWDTNKIRGIVRNSSYTEVNGKKIRVSSEMPSFSFLNSIVLNKRDLSVFEDGFEQVLAHENAHVKQVHSLDLLLANIVRSLFWFNPVAWKLQSAVSENCEFLADQYVLENTGKAANSYAILVLDRCIDSAENRTALHHSFNRNFITRRIKMLTINNPQSRPWAAYGFAFLAILFAGGIISCSADGYGPDEVVEVPLKIEDEVDVMAEFPGGQAELINWMVNQIKYPKDAYDQGIQGRSMISFVIDENGNVTKPTVAKGFHESCDNEALRVVGSMPKWTPAMKDDKAVASKLVLPIQFALPPAE